MKYAIWVSVCCLLTCACQRKWNLDVHLTNVKEATFRFPSQSVFSNISVSMLVNVQGNCSDTLYISYVALPPGKLDTTLRLDWYSDTAYLRVHAPRVVTGNIAIKAKAL